MCGSFSMIHSITVRIGLVPLPRAFDDFAHMGKSGRPAKLVANLVAGGHEHSGIAATARRGVRAYRSAGYLARCIDDLFDGKTFAITQIVKPAAPIEGTQSQYVRLRKIYDMDIIAYARPIAGRVVISKNGNLFALSERDLEDEWDDVKLRVMVFAMRRSGSCSVKIAQTREAHSTNPVKPVKH